MKKYLLYAVVILTTSVLKLQACLIPVSVPCIDVESGYLQVNVLSLIDSCPTYYWYEPISATVLQDVIDIRLWFACTQPTPNIFEWTQSASPGYLGTFAAPISKSVADVNNDGLLDLVLYFSTANLVIDPNCASWAALLIKPLHEGRYTFFHNAVPVEFCDTPEEPAGCTYTPGYWKTHSEYGPAPYDDRWMLLTQSADTEFFLSGLTYYQVLWTTLNGGNVYYILAHAYIAAQLNRLNGASAPSEVVEAYDKATALLMLYIPTQAAVLKGKNSVNPVREEFIQVAGVLDQYNNGVLGPGHCD